MLELRNLTKIYHTEQEGSLALKNISLVFPEKGFVAITGESGSGKTTLLNVLSGFVSYEEGDFLVDGVDFLAFSDEDLEKYRRETIGFVFQDYHLIENYTVIDNLISALLAVGVSYKEAKKKSLDCLKEFKLDHIKDAKVHNISSGQKQKLSIARAIIKEPRLILCDEPTANLDPENSILVLELLAKFAKNHLVILSTHNYDDASKYATHFVRIYKGNLTSYEQIKEVENNEVDTVNKEKGHALRLFSLAAKNQPFKIAMKVAFFAFFVAALTLLLGLFVSNIDDSSTKILSRKTFNNINQNELVIMRKDRDLLSLEELDELKAINHIKGTQLYGLASEMNYFYRDGVDYANQIKIVRLPDPVNRDNYIEVTEEVFTVLKEDMYIKDYLGMVNENDLKEGHLPNSFTEVVASNEYHIGDTIPVYLHDPVLQSTAYFKYDFVVSGLLKEKSDDLYFSPAFTKAIDYIQYHSNENLFRFNLKYQKWSKSKGRYESKTTSFDVTPLLKPSLGPYEIQLPKNIIERMRTEGFPTDEDILGAFVSSKDNSIKLDVLLCSDLFTDEITSAYIYIGEEIMHAFMDDHVSHVARVFVDNYPYVDDVITRLVDKKYDCLSEYRASSTEYDPGKQIQRAIILILSLVLIAVEALAYYIFGSMFEKGKLNDDMTLLLVGASSNELGKVSLIGIIFTQLLAFLLGVGIFFGITAINVPFIVNIKQYLRFYHFFIIIAILVVVNFFIWFKYVRRLNKSLKNRRVN